MAFRNLPVVADEFGVVPEDMLVFLERRTGRVVGAIVGLERPPMSVEVFYRLHAAAVAARLEAFAQELQRRRLMREHRHGVALRLRRAWSVVEAHSPYRSTEVH